MKIGLVRHFKVEISFPSWKLLSKAEMEAWFEVYNAAPVQCEDLDLGEVSWTRKYTSPMRRALLSAHHISKGNWMVEEALQELNVMPLLHTRWRWPLIVWAIWARMKYSASNEVTDAFRQRIAQFVDELLSDGHQDTLIVSHGFVMICIREELIRRGFAGDKIRSPQYGRVYLFER